MSRGVGGAPYATLTLAIGARSTIHAGCMRPPPPSLQSVNPIQEKKKTKQKNAQLTIRMPLPPMLLHIHMRVQVVQRPVRLRAPRKRARIQPLDLVVAPPRPLAHRVARSETNEYVFEASCAPFGLLLLLDASQPTQGQGRPFRARTQRQQPQARPLSARGAAARSRPPSPARGQGACIQKVGSPQRTRSTLPTRSAPSWSGDARCCCRARRSRCNSVVAAGVGAAGATTHRCIPHMPLQWAASCDAHARGVCGGGGKAGSRLRSSSSQTFLPRTRSRSRRVRVRVQVEDGLLIHPTRFARPGIRLRRRRRREALLFKGGLPLEERVPLVRVLCLQRVRRCVFRREARGEVRL